MPRILMCALLATLVGSADAQSCQPCRNVEPGVTHCPWDVAQLTPPLIATPPSSPVSTGVAGEAPFALSVAMSSEAAVAGSNEALTHATAVTSSAAAVSATAFLVYDTVTNCNCNTIPRVVATVSYWVEAEADVHGMVAVSTNQFLSVVNQWAAAASKVELIADYDLIQSVTEGTTGSMSVSFGSGVKGGGFNFGFGGGGFDYSRNPAPVRRLVLALASGSAPGAASEFVTGAGAVSTSATIDLRPGKPIPNVMSRLKAQIANYVAHWSFDYSCPTCQTTGTLNHVVTAP